MSSSNYRSFMHATSQVLQMIETAKACVDDMIDDLSAGFVVIDGEGKILRANHAVAELLGVDSEKCLNRSLFDVFDSENAPRVKNALEETIRNGESKRLEVAVRPIPGGDGSPRIFQWSISPLEERGADGSALFSVLGSDVSELRSSQSRVSEIFSALPVGILAVGPGGKIADLYTSYAEHLLGMGREELIGRPIRDVLFPDGLNRFTKGQKKALEALSAFESLDGVLFDALKDSCPQEVKIGLPESQGGGFRYLGLTTQSISSDGQIVKLLLLVQDKTAIVEAREADKAEREAETASIRRILQIKRVSKDVLPIFVEELTNLVKRAQDLSRDRKSKDLAAALHGIKGNSRVVRFEQLGEMSHSLEDVVLNQASVGDEDTRWQQIQTAVAQIAEEWNELSGLAGALLSAEEAAKGSDDPALGNTSLNRDGKGKAISSLRTLLDNLHAQRVVQPSANLDLAVERVRLALVGLNLVDAKTLEPWLTTSANQTSETVGKPVRLEMEWGSVLLDEAIRKTLTEVLLHLVNNAIDHGVDSKEARLSKGKSPEGLIKLQLSETDGLIRGVVSDDGPGIDVEKVKRTAMRIGVATTQDFIGKSRRELMRYIFESGLSTREQVSQVSGRGVGLSAVVESIKAINGSIEVMDSMPTGTRFEFTMEYSSPLRAVKRAYPGIQVWDRLKTVLDFMVKSQNCPFEVVSYQVDPSAMKGMLLCSPNHLVIALTQKILDFAKGGRVSVQVGLLESGRVAVKVERAKGATIPYDPGAISPEFLIAPAVTDRLLSLHSGSSQETEQNLTLSFEEWVQTRDLPEFGITFAAAVPSARVVELRQWFEILCDQSRVEVVPPKSAKRKIDVQVSPDIHDPFSVAADLDRETFEARVLRAINRAMGIEY